MDTTVFLAVLVAALAMRERVSRRRWMSVMVRGAGVVLTRI